MLGCGPSWNHRIANCRWTSRGLPDRQTVYTEADAERLAVVMLGLLRVYMHATDGRQVTVRYVRAGDLLGVPALVGGPAPVFVQAVTPAQPSSSTSPRSNARRLPTRPSPGRSRRNRVHRLYDVLEELAGNTFASVRQRVARHLLDLAASRPDASRTLTALVNQQDLANSVGSVREVVARVLAELRAEGLVRTSPGRVEILDPIRMSHRVVVAQRVTKVTALENRPGTISLEATIDRTSD